MRAGFTLIEMILVLALLSILALSSVSFFSGYQRDTDLTTTAQNIVSVLRFAEGKAIAGQGTQTWGVHFDTASAGHFVALFQGTSYDSGTDIEQTPLTNGTQLSNVALNGGGFDVVFSRLTGTTTNYGTGPNGRAVCITNLTDPTGCRKSVAINQAGRINGSANSP